jgi:hypothetical protein
MEAVRTSETSVDNYFTRQYIPEDNSERHTRRRENLKSHINYTFHTCTMLGLFFRLHVSTQFSHHQVEVTTLIPNTTSM